MNFLLLQSVSTAELLEDAAGESAAEFVLSPVTLPLAPVGAEDPSTLVGTAVSDEPASGEDEGFFSGPHPANTIAAKALRSKMLPVDFFIFVTLLSVVF
jgi:hypothetical protein